MKILVIENDVFRINKLINYFDEYNIKIADTVTLAIEYLSNNVFDIIHMGNDLKNNIISGYGTDVADFLYNNKSNRNNEAYIIVHTWDINACKYINSKLNRSQCLPFISNMDFY